MAQQNTGLGWSAKEEWLTQSGNTTIANIGGLMGGTAFPGQPLPKNLTSAADVIAHGLYFGTIRNSDGIIDTVFVASASDATIYACETDSPVMATFYSDTDDSYVIWVRVREPGGAITRQELKCTAAYNVTGGKVYRFTQQKYYAEWNPSISVPHFASDAEACNNLYYATDPIMKTNAGYAVSCVAKWKTQNGTELASPILISSDTDSVDMTTTATGYNFAKLNYLLSGLRFYMGFWDIPGDIVLTTPLQEVDFTDRGYMTLDQLFMTIVSASYAHVIIINSPDPYSEEGAGSGEEGGDGEDLEDDEMGISHHAIPAAINTGFCRIYCPSEQQLRDLSNYLWSAQYDLAAVKKLFANPMDSVLGLSAVPLTLGGANRPVYLGGVDTEMSFPMVDYQSYQVPMGAITVEKRWGSYLDYDPYTRFSIFLPFIGFKDLSADDIMGKQIILDYDVDILSGACTARLQAGGNVLYQWSGQCSIQLPVTASNWNQVFQGATSAALTAGLAVATGSAGPVLAGALAAEGAQAIMGKPRIERGGSASGAAGWMGGLTPYLVRVTPEAIIPNDQNKFIGYPAFSSISLGDLTGYNEISSIHLEGIPATGAELEELEAILKGGVIF